MENLQKTWISDPTFLSLCYKVDAGLKNAGFNDGLFRKPSFTIILACSGGPDSVFVAYYLYYKNCAHLMKVILCYFDHEWRKEAKNEVAFCNQLAQDLGFVFETRTASAQKEKTGQRAYGSKEAEARELRYAFLHEMKEKYGATLIVLGHHKDDQIETFFIRMIRGTSLSGLCGMKILDTVLLRPLLEILKSDIVFCLDALQISYCIDTSNLDLSLLRNRVRTTLIPALQGVDQRSMNNINRLMQRLHNAEDCLEEIVNNIFKNITKQQDDSYSISISKLHTLHKELQYRVLLLFFIKHKVKMTYTEALLQEVLRFLKHSKSKIHQIAQDIVVVKENDCVSLSIWNRN